MERHSIILLNGPRISKCNFELRKGEPGKPQKEIEIKTACEYSFHTNYLTNLNRLEVSIKAKMKGDDLPFHFEVTAEAQLQLNEKIDASEAHKLGMVFGGPYVFTILKDYIMDLTRKAYLHVFVIPPIDFDAVAHIPTKDKKIAEGQEPEIPKRKSTKTARPIHK